MSNTANEKIMNNFENNKKPVQYLNLRERFTPFNLPAVEEHSVALNETLPDPQGMLISTPRGRG